MSYKVLVSGVVVDAVVIPVYVRYHRRAGLFWTCNKEEAEGIVSHDESTYWIISGKIDFEIDGYQTVELEEVEPEVAKLIIDAIDAGKEPPEITYPDIPNDDPVASEEDVERVRGYVIDQMSGACENAILAGFDIVDTSGEIRHYSLSIEDQMNLLSLQNSIEKYGDNIPYHADGCSYRHYTRAEFEEIVDAANAHRLHHCIYFNRLKRYVCDIVVMSELAKVSYGMDIPEQYKNDGL